MIFRQLFDTETSTYTYLLGDEASREAVLIDPVLEQVERDLTTIKELGLVLVYALDTHVHADHVTALGTLRERTKCKTVVSERAGTGCPDVLVKQGDLVRFGAHALEVRETPGHTDGCLSYVLADHTMAFTGDAILIRGTGRTDFQQGDARTLHASIHEQLFTLPDTCLLYPAHDYKGRTVTTVAEEKAFNPRVGGGKTATEFVAIMDALVLAHPKKIDVALPANLACGVPASLSVTGEHVDRAWAPIEMSASGIPEVSAEWVAGHRGRARVVDVREEAEWTSALGHIEDATLTPLARIDEASHAWDTAEPVVLVCRSGGRSAKAAMSLAARGFTRVASMRGGMTAWANAKLPVVDAAR
jgi:sulfur dioxygenase